MSGVPKRNFSIAELGDCLDGKSPGREAIIGHMHSIRAKFQNCKSSDLSIILSITPDA